ncbi:hypothetical protein F1880_007955 [Penicillium rolfsii]|nr:hypothetical protein F1880_007955 [Penicillium rolfsii]
MRRLKREELEQGLSDHAFDSTHHGQESIPSSVPSGSGSVSPISTNQVDFPGSLLQSAQTSPSAASQQLPTFLPSSLDPAVITPRGQAPTTTDPNMQSQAPTTVSSNLDLLWQTNPLLEMDWEENLLATNGDSKTEPGNEVDGNTKAPLVECSIRCRRRRLKSMVNHLVDAAMKESADSATEDDHVTLTLQLKS